MHTPSIMEGADLMIIQNRARTAVSILCTAVKATIHSIPIGITASWQHTLSQLKMLAAKQGDARQ